MIKNTLAQQDLSFLTNIIAANASGRNDTTLAAALTAIGTQRRTLVLQDEGDGYWTFNNPHTFPETCSVIIPAGVIVIGSGVLTFLGRVWAMRDDWYQGSGSYVMSRTSHFVSGIAANSLGLLQGAKTTTAITVTLNASFQAAQLTASSIIPQGARVEAVTSYITTGFTGGKGLATLAIGDMLNGVFTMDRWGRTLSPTQGAQTTGSAFNDAMQPMANTGPGDIVVSAEGGLFDTTGQIVLTIVYSTYTPRLTA